VSGRSSEFFMAWLVFATATWDSPEKRRNLRIAIYIAMKILGIGIDFSISLGTPLKTL
jgi:hypothetical protein